MNGRIYDPTLGRFLQADPFIQAPSNSQSYNRYAYVLNNPLSYTDPSGYFFKRLFKGIKKYWRQIVSIGMMFIPGMQTFAMATWYNAAAVGVISGGIATGSLRGALVGAFTGAALQTIGSSATWGEAGSAKNIIANASVGGIAADLNGGKFGHGFFAAGFTASFKTQINKIGSGEASYAPARITAAAVIGGTTSVISGGKFANGAVTGAFIQMFNAETALAEKKKMFNAKVKAGMLDVFEAGYDLDKGAMGTIMAAKDGFSAGLDSNGNWTLNGGGTSLTVGSYLIKGSFTKSIRMASLSLSSDNTGTLTLSGQIKVGSIYAGVDLQMNPQLYLRATIMGQRISDYATGAVTRRRTCEALEMGC